jgi:hypothetical protein
VLGEDDPSPPRKATAWTERQRRYALWVLVLGLSAVLASLSLWNSTGLFWIGVCVLLALWAVGRWVAEHEA